MTYCFCDSSATCPATYIFCPEMELPPLPQHQHEPPHEPREADGPIDGSVNRSVAGTI